jgi:hypothetical protein
MTDTGERRAMYIWPGLLYSNLSPQMNQNKASHAPGYLDERRIGGSCTSLAFMVFFWHPHQCRLELHIVGQCAKSV